MREKRLGIRLGTYSSSQYDSVTKCENPNSKTQFQTKLGTSRITTSSRRLTQVTSEILATQKGQVGVLTTHKNHSSVQTPHRGHNSSSMSTHNGHSPAQVASKNHSYVQTPHRGHNSSSMSTHNGHSLAQVAYKSHSSSLNNPKSQGSRFALTNSRRVTS